MTALAMAQPASAPYRITDLSELTGAAVFSLQLHEFAAAGRGTGHQHRFWHQ